MTIMHLSRHRMPSFLAAAAAVISLFAGTQTFAADLAATTPAPVVQEPQNRWTFAVTPYLWATGLKGDVGVKGLQPVPVDISFGDILDHFKFGVTVAAEATNGEWGIWGDIIYLKTQTNASITRTLARRPLNLSADVEMSAFTGTLMGEYRVTPAENVNVDLMAGARVWSMSTDIESYLTAGGPRVKNFSGSESETWVDPMVGAKVRIDTSTPFYITAGGLLGGFGVSSKISWDVTAGVGYDWNSWSSSYVGYRALGVDYENNGFSYDVVQQGIVMGTTFKF